MSLIRKICNPIFSFLILGCSPAINTVEVFDGRGLGKTFLSLSPSGDYLVAGKAWGGVEIRNLKDNTMQVLTGLRAQDGVFLDERALITIDGVNIIKYDINSDFQHTLVFSDPNVSRTVTKIAHCAALNKVFIGGGEGEILVFDYRQGYLYGPEIRLTIEGIVISMDCSGEYLVFSSISNKIYIYSAVENRELYTIPRRAELVRFIDGEQLFISDIDSRSYIIKLKEISERLDGSVNLREIPVEGVFLEAKKLTGAPSFVAIDMNRHAYLIGLDGLGVQTRKTYSDKLRGLAVAPNENCRYYIGSGNSVLLEDVIDCEYIEKD